MITFRLSANAVPDYMAIGLSSPQLYGPQMLEDPDILMQKTSSQENNGKIGATRCQLDFKAKMHQIRFPLRLRPRPRWGSLERSPRPIAVFKGLRRGGGRKWGKGPFLPFSPSFPLEVGPSKGRGRERKGKRDEKREGKGKGREGDRRRGKKGTGMKVIGRGP